MSKAANWSGGGERGGKTLLTIQEIAQAFGDLAAIIFGDAGERAASFSSPRDASNAAIEIFVDYKSQVVDPGVLPYLRSRVEYWHTASKEKADVITSQQARIEQLEAALGEVKHMESCKNSSGSFGSEFTGCNYMCSKEAIENTLGGSR